MKTNQITPNMMKVKQPPNPAFAARHVQRKKNAGTSIPMGRKSSARTVVAKKINECTHVNVGAVWCQECANANLAYARNQFKNAQASGRKDLVDYKKKCLAKALHEFSLTKDGLVALEREYAKLSSLDAIRAKSFLIRMHEFQKESSSRNKQARENAARKKMQGHSTMVTRYVSPPRDEFGKMTSENVILRSTHHTSQRMGERNISFDEMESSLRSVEHFTPQGSGRWKLIGSNGIALCGFFERYQHGVEFISTTTYHVEESQPE